MMAKRRIPTVKRSTRKRGAPKSQAPDPGAAEKWLQKAVQALVSLLLPIVKELRIKPFRERSEPPVAKYGSPPGATDLVIYIEDRNTLWISTQLGNNLPKKLKAPHGSDSIRILEFMLHELIHWLLGYECGHRGLFTKIAIRTGFTGKLTYPTSDKSLLVKLKKIIQRLKDFPNEAVTKTSLVDAPGHRRQKNRQRKYVCKRCGKIIRSAGTDLKAIHLCNGEITKPYGYFGLSE